MTAKYTTAKRRTGATLSLVAVVTLVVLIVGLGAYWLIKILGGGREMADANDAGQLNVAKYALRYPGKDPVKDFSNPDVASNFGLLTDSATGKIDLLVYNRLVAQSLLVALNASDENTSQAADDAKKVWTALNDVGKALRQDLESKSFMNTYYMQTAAKNSQKMNGGQDVVLNELNVAFVKRGGSTNVWINPAVLATVSKGSVVPQNSGGRKSLNGNSYLAGYAPITVQCGAYSLDFSGVPVAPQDRPHLISYTDFLLNSKDDFVSSKGSPAYPADTIPPNSFETKGSTMNLRANTPLASVACAMVGCLNFDYQMQIPNGYIEVVNGPSEDGWKNLSYAQTYNDAFSNYPGLAGPGIAVSHNRQYFCPGDCGGDLAKALKLNVSPFDALKNLSSGSAGTRSAIEGFAGSHGYLTAPDPVTGSRSIDEGAVDAAYSQLTGLRALTMTGEKNNDYAGLTIIDVWVWINESSSQLMKDYLWSIDIPSKEESLAVIRRGDGSFLSGADELRNLHRLEATDSNCQWFRDYSANPTVDPCMNMLPAFRIGYKLNTSSSPAQDNGTGYTALELLKTEVLNNRINCPNVPTKPIVPSAIPPSGTKLFQHGKSYPAPNINPLNFGAVATPWQYLAMIDEVTPGKCGEGAVIDALLKRCQQIQPNLSKSDLQNALSSQPLPLGATLYLYCSNQKLMMSTQKPVSVVPGTTVDGVTSQSAPPCGAPYKVMGTLVNTNSGGNKSPSSVPYNTTDSNCDGLFPGWAWHDSDSTTCQDTATFTPSSGYNNLLGRLSFANACQGSCGLSRPN